jgi:hypothetical protein
MRNWMCLFESSQTVTLYHGTCEGSARALMSKGWQPNSVQQGANRGQTRYLYMTSGPEDALWFAEEKGCDTVLEIRNVPIAMLRVDPEDGTYDTVEQELNSPNGFPGKVVLTGPLGPEHFSLYRGKLFEGATSYLGNELDALIAKAAEQGVTLRAHAYPDVIDLDFIARKSGQPGSGAAVMTELCQLADRHGVQITLYVASYDPKLEAYYEDFGFVTDPDGEDEAEMIRIPQLAEDAHSTPNIITVYHGDEKENVQLHPGMFFSTDPDFCTSYGKHITKWEIDLTRFLDSLDPDLIEPLLPLYDPYTDSEINDWSDYEDRSSDTWEIIEDRAKGLCDAHGAAGMIIYEGGIRNFIVYDTSVVSAAQ